ncbi:MAG: hypothetical protein LBB43_00635 [Spirochaetaceae bacterium]|nr:hypothetical protein [Spirochaetaceae bacterium]
MVKEAIAHTDNAQASALNDVLEYGSPITAPDFIFAYHFGEMRYSSPTGTACF